MDESQIGAPENRDRSIPVSAEAKAVQNMTRQSAEVNYTQALLSVFDTFIFDKDLSVPGNKRERLGLAIRAFPKFRDLAVILTVTSGLFWVIWFYLAELGHFPELKNFGDVFALAIIGLTGPIVSIYAGIALLGSGFLLSACIQSDPRVVGTFSNKRFVMPFIFYVVGSILAGIVVCVLSRPQIPFLTPGLIFLNILGPAIAVIIYYRSQRFDVNSFNLISNLFFASFFWGTCSLLTSIVIAAYFINDFKPQDARRYALFCEFLALLCVALINLIQIKVGRYGFFAAFTLFFFVCVFFAGPFLRDAPFRVWHIGGITSRVVFTNYEEEHKVRARCKMQALQEKHTFLIYIISRLPNNVWYRCNTTHRIKNSNSDFVARELDPRAVIIDDR